MCRCLWLAEGCTIFLHQQCSPIALCGIGTHRVELVDSCGKYFFVIKCNEGKCKKRTCNRVLEIYEILQVVRKFYCELIRIKFLSRLLGNLFGHIHELIRCLPWMLHPVNEKNKKWRIKRVKGEVKIENEILLVRDLHRPCNHLCDPVLQAHLIYAVQNELHHLRSSECQHPRHLLSKSHFLRPAVIALSSQFRWYDQHACAYLLQQIFKTEFLENYFGCVF